MPWNTKLEKPILSRKEEQHDEKGYSEFSYQLPLGETLELVLLREMAKA